MIFCQLAGMAQAPGLVGRFNSEYAAKFDLQGMACRQRSARPPLPYSVPAGADLLYGSPS